MGDPTGCAHDYQHDHDGGNDGCYRLLENQESRDLLRYDLGERPGNGGRRRLGRQRVGCQAFAQASQNVRRCESVPTSARLDYWDVTYNFGGYEHRVQLTAPPGPTIVVNGQGEPRV